MNWGHFHLLPRLSVFQAEVASTSSPHPTLRSVWEVLDNFQSWAISRILVRSKKAHCLLLYNWGDHVFFSPTLTCISVRGFIPLLQKEKWLIKKSDSAKASESSVMLIEVRRETVEEMGAVPCSLLVLRRLCRGELGIAWEKAGSWMKGCGRERKRAKETLRVPVVHLGTLVLALKMFL